MSQNNQAGFRSLLPKDIDWKPFPAYPPEAGLAIISGKASEPSPYMIRVKVPGGVKLLPHKHPEDRIYTVISGVFYTGRGDQFDPESWKPTRQARLLFCPAIRPTSTGRNQANTSPK